ncbi:hypothetical protein COOONC_02825 [Cooperia oncophora]
MRMDQCIPMVGAVALPEKRSPGTIGSKFELVTNLTALKFSMSTIHNDLMSNLELKPNVPYYKYDVRMYIVYKGDDAREHLKELTKQTKDDFPEQERKVAAVAVYKHILKSCADVFPKDGTFFYDRAAVLFSAQRELKLGGEEKVMMLPASLVSAAGSGATGIRVVIKKVTDGYQTSPHERFHIEV